MYASSALTSAASAFVAVLTTLCCAPTQYGRGGGGLAGGGIMRNPVYEAWEYDPYAPQGARYKVLAASTVKRLYHSTASLMTSGEIVVMGSEFGGCTGCGPNSAGMVWHGVSTWDLVCPACSQHPFCFSHCRLATIHALWVPNHAWL